MFQQYMVKALIVLLVMQNVFFVQVIAADQDVLPSQQSQDPENPPKNTATQPQAEQVATTQSASNESDQNQQQNSQAEQDGQQDQGQEEDAQLDQGEDGQDQQYDQDGQELDEGQDGDQQEEQDGQQQEEEQTQGLQQGQGTKPNSSQISDFSIFQSPQNDYQDPYISYGDQRQEFKKFKSKFKRNYNTPSQKKKRYNIFGKNLKTIKKHNNQISDYQMGVNQFADLTDKQFRDQNLMTLDENTQMEQRMDAPIPEWLQELNRQNQEDTGDASVGHIDQNDKTSSKKSSKSKSKSSSKTTQKKLGKGKSGKKPILSKPKKIQKDTQSQAQHADNVFSQKQKRQRSKASRKNKSKRRSPYLKINSDLFFGNSANQDGDGTYKNRNKLRRRNSGSDISELDQINDIED